MKTLTFCEAIHRSVALGKKASHLGVALKVVTDPLFSFIVYIGACFLCASYTVALPAAETNLKIFWWTHEVHECLVYATMNFFPWLWKRVAGSQKPEVPHQASMIWARIFAVCIVVFHILEACLVVFDIMHIIRTEETLRFVQVILMMASATRFYVLSRALCLLWDAVSVQTSVGATEHIKGPVN